MPLDQNQAELDYALAQQRDDAYRHAQLLRDLIGVAADIARALQQQAISAATEIPITGGQPRGADLTPSFDRLSRAIRRNALLVTKLNADIVGHCHAAPTLYPLPPHAPAVPPAVREPSQATADPQPPTIANPSDTERLDRLDHDRDEPFAEIDDTDRNNDHGDSERKDTVPDRPIPELVEGLKRDLARADPRQPAPPPITAPEQSPDAPPAQPKPRWVYQPPPLEPPIPGFLSLDDLRRIPPGPSG